MNVVAVILGGGEGKRLQPLTRDRCKPAVPLAGKYRLVDIPVSNCINSGIRRIYVLTQFNSVSLHQHVQSTYVFDQFHSGYVRILAAQQTPGNIAIGANTGAVLQSGLPGTLTLANGGDSVALGSGAQSTGFNSVALGAGSSDGGLANVVSVGNATDMRSIINLAAWIYLVVTVGLKAKNGQTPVVPVVSKWAAQWA